MWFVVTGAGILLHASKKNSYYASVYMMPTFVIKNTVGEPELIIV